MNRVQWQDSFSVGIPTLDAQHRKLIGIINKLQDALVTRRTSEVLGQIIVEMKTYAATHFKTEEEYLERYDYPELATHREEHVEFLARVDGYRFDHELGRPVKTRQVLAFLRDWWLRHIQGSDQQYSTFLRNRGVK